MTDPNLCVQNIIGNIKSANAYAGGRWSDYWEAAFQGMEDLFNWLHRGGVGDTSVLVPDKTYISLGNGGVVAYSLLSLPNRGLLGEELEAGCAVFIRYEYSKITGQFEESHKYVLTLEGVRR